MIELTKKLLKGFLFMDRIFGTTTVIQEAAMTVKKRGFIKVTLIFLLVFLVGSMIASMVLSVPLSAYMMSDSRLVEAIMSGDMEEYEKIYTDMANNLPEWLTVISLFATVGTIAASVFYCTKMERRRLFTLGFVKKGAVKEYLAGLAIGLIMFSAAFGIVILSGDTEVVKFNSDVSVGMILLFFAGYIIQGMSEEVLLRGYYFVSGCYSSKNVALSVFVSSAFFAFLHLGNAGVSVMGILNIFLFGVFAALYFLRRGSIWGIGAIHTMWNFAQGNIFGCYVSGNKSGSSLLTIDNVAGNTIFNGGAFGPEGGIGVTIILFVGIVILLPMKNKEIAVQYNGEFYSA